VYFEVVGRPLVQVVGSEGVVREVGAWFLLNEMSKALEILEESGRAHWGVSPETVYRNENMNYLVYDSVFVLGPDPTSKQLLRVETFSTR
jgi:hypothetical protein